MSKTKVHVHAKTRFGRVGVAAFSSFLFTCDRTGTIVGLDMQNY